MAADVTKDIMLSPQYRKNRIVIMGTAVSLKCWEYLDEGVDSNGEQLAQKIWWI